MSEQPNFLFFFSDQHRGDWMPYDDATRQRLGVGDLKLNMPNIRRLMHRGTSFSCAISPAPVCAPARACLASGRRYRSCRVYQNNTNYDTALPSFYGMLRDNGYFVTGTGKFDLNKGDLEWGDLKNIGFSVAQDSEGKMDAIWAVLQGKPGPYGKMLESVGWLEAYKEDMINRGGRDISTPIPDEYYADNWIGRKSCEMIKKLPKNQPWLMQINFSGPHDPWDITESMKYSMAGRVFPDAADCDFPEKNQGVRQNYAAMIENIDKNIGRCIDALENQGMLDNTIIIYGADHGEMMGDHSLYGKSKPEQGSIHIPMVIDASKYGRVIEKVNHTPVELQDLAATILDYAGIESGRLLESESLRPIVEGKTRCVREYAVSELITRNARTPFDSFAAVTDGGWKLIMRPGREDRLYNLRTDPFECDDMSGAYPEIIERLKNGFSDRGERPNPIFLQYKKSFDV